MLAEHSGFGGSFSSVTRPYDIGWKPGTSFNDPNFEPFGSQKKDLGELSSVSDSLGDVDYSKLPELFASAVRDLSHSALEAEEKATKAYNDLQYKMFQEANQFNSSEAIKAFEREQSSANKAMEFERSERIAQQDWEKYMSDTAMQRRVFDLRSAGLNPVLALMGIGEASSPSSSFGSGIAASSSSARSASHQMAKANSSSALSVQERMLDSILSAAASILIARETNATRESTALINGIFGLVPGFNLSGAVK